MAKTIRTFLVLSLSSLALIFLTGCPSQQSPTASDTGALGNRGFDSGGSGGSGGIDGIIPPSNPDDWGIDDLSPRDASMSAGKWGDYDIIENVLPSVYFDFDSASVGGAERSKIQEAADYLMKNQTHKILIEGHCDWYGTAEYNLALGDRRAQSVADFLTTLGIDPTRIETVSKGSLEATSGLSKSQSSEDRRADLNILSK